MTTTIDDLIAWLLEQVDEDMRIASEARAYDIEADTEDLGPTLLDSAERLEPPLRNFVKRHDPVAALTDCRAKRAIIKECQVQIEIGSDVTSGSRLAKHTLRTYGAMYAAAGRAGYRPEWSDDDD